MPDEERHENPFWREQEATLTRGDRIMGAIGGFIEKLIPQRRPAPIKNEGTANTLSRAQYDFAKYEAMVKEGRAERVGEMPCDWDDFRTMERAYRRDTNKFEGYYFRAVPRYGKVAGSKREYQFLHIGMVYKIRR